MTAVPAGITSGPPTSMMRSPSIKTPAFLIG